MNRNTNLCFICTSCTSFFRFGNKPKVFHNQNVMSKLIRVGEYWGKIIAKSTSFGRYILQNTRVGKYSRTACMSDQCISSIGIVQTQWGLYLSWVIHYKWLFKILHMYMTLNLKYHIAQWKLLVMAIRVVEFSNGVYKIRKIFA